MLCFMRRSQVLLLLSTLATRRVSCKYVSSQEALQTALQHHQAGRLTDALDYYDMVISKLKKKTPIAVYSNQGAALLALDRGDEAEKAWKLALEIDPSHAESHVNLAISLQGDASFSTERLEDALYHAKEAISLNPKYVKAHHALGNAFQALGDVSSAYKHFDIADALANEQANKATSNSGSNLEEQASSQFQLPSSIIPSHVGDVIKAVDGLFEIEALSLPVFKDKKMEEGCLILQIDQFLSPQECEHIKALASSRLRESYVVGGGGDVSTTEKRGLSVGTNGISYGSNRKSTNTWLPMGRDEVLANIRSKTARLLNIELSSFISLAEDLQVVHYDVGEYFDLHHDSSTSFQKRKITFLIYLNDLYEENSGGETYFPLASATNSSSSCDVKEEEEEDSKTEKGLYVKPKMGRAILFLNLDSENKPNPKAVHQALPIKSGEKWIANFWVRDK